jgi:hypothetical protein
VEYELVKIVRHQTPHHQPNDNDFSHIVLSAVRFAPLAAYPVIETVIPGRIWNPTVHKYFPDSFRSSCKELLLCSLANYDQPIQKQPKTQVNVACMLPRALWMEVISYTHRDCKWDSFFVDATGVIFCLNIWLF